MEIAPSFTRKKAYDQAFCPHCKFSQCNADKQILIRKFCMKSEP